MSMFSLHLRGLETSFGADCRAAARRRAENSNPDEPPVTGPEPGLSDARREIDRIDATLHDLIMLRTEVVMRVRALKAAGGGGAMGFGAFYRPQREAEVLRRLLDRHAGAFPLPALVRIWREMMATYLGLQHAVSVLVPAGETGLRELARDHFGVMAKITECADARAVVKGVAADPATLGVAPFPAGPETVPWWNSLIGLREPSSVRIVARVPSVSFDPAAPQAVVIGTVERDADSPEHTLIAIEALAGTNREDVLFLLSESGLGPATIIASVGRRLHLAEVRDRLPLEDARAATLASFAGVRMVRVIGGYPAPLDRGAEPGR